MTVILEPFQLGSLTLKNRIIFAPTSLGLKEEEEFSFYQEIAKGGVAMIIVGDVFAGKAHGYSLFNKKGLNHYKKIIDLAHQNNTLICAQLHQSDSDFTSLLKHIPALLVHRMTLLDLRKKLNESVAPHVSTMPISKIHSILEDFKKSASIAQEIGFDMIQVHGDRLCGSFSSSLFNHRTDQYGGTVHNRCRFACEVVQAVASGCQLPIDYKLAIRQENPHYGNAGVLLEELSTFVACLEKAGVQSFHVTLANHGELSDTIPPLDHPYFKGEGCFLPFVDEVRKWTTLPICGVGNLRTPQFIQQQLQSNRFQLASMCRQLIADPQWLNKVAQQKETTIVHCVGCNKKCLGGIQSHQGVHCIYDKKKTSL